MDQMKNDQQNQSFQIFLEENHKNMENSGLHLADLEVNIKSKKLQVLNRKTIKRQVNKKAQEWKNKGLFPQDKQNQPYLYSLYDLMAECLEYLLNKCATDNKERGNFEQDAKTSTEKIQEIFYILLTRERELESQTNLGILYSLIDAFKDLANQLYTQRLSKHQDFLNTITNANNAELRKAVLGKIALIHYNTSEKSSVYSDQSFNPVYIKQRAKKKAYTTHGLPFLLSPSQIELMRKRLMFLKNSKVRQKLINNLDEELSQNGKQMVMINRQCELMGFDSANKMESSQEIEKEGMKQIYQGDNASQKTEQVSKNKIKKLDMMDIQH